MVGDLPLVRAKISRAMLHTLRKEGQGFLVEHNQLERKEPLAKEVEMSDINIPPFLQGVMRANASVFTKVMGLPLMRGHEHLIILKYESNPVGF